MEYRGYIIEELDENFCKANQLVHPTFLVKHQDGSWVNDCESAEEAREFIDRIS